ncbi:MAG: hypothetical protein V3W34_09260, partial [Phycisphaerae bacterium]
MPGTLQSVKSAALETYISLCSSDARRIRAIDERQEQRCRPQNDELHIRAALDWLCRAHDVGTDDGVSAMFSFAEGWLGSYPETTGYIIPTFYDLARRFDNEEYAERAAEMARWLSSLQTRDGAFPGSFLGQLSSPRVFNTGQVIFGLVRAVAETGQDRFLEAAVRAGDWLISQQDADGAWRRSTFSEIVHAYNVRTAWAMAELAAISGEQRFREAAVRNAQWVLDQQDHSGWFRNNTFNAREQAASLHTIAYATRGLLEIGAAAGRQEFVDGADRAASALYRGWRLYDGIGGAYGRDWCVSAPWRCLPGEAQLAVVWMRLDQLTKKDTYKDAAVTLLDRVKAAQ